MTVLARILFYVLDIGAIARGLAGQGMSGQDGYVPIASVPLAQQLPAAPFLIAAYAFIWVALVAYVWSIWRRVENARREIRALEVRSRRAGAA